MDNQPSLLDRILQTFDTLTTGMTQHASLLFTIILIATGVYVINRIFFRNALNALGIQSRRPFGLVGILFAPWLHGSIGHLAMNAILFFILASMTLVIIPLHKFIQLNMILFLGTGLLTWAFGRRANHIGASGVIMGYWGFLLVSAYHNPSVITIITALVCLFYFGSMAKNLVPTDPRHSWESHLFGCLCGVGAAFLPIF